MTDQKAAFPYGDPFMGGLDAILRLYSADLSPADLAAWQQARAAFLQAQERHREACAIVCAACCLEEADNNLRLVREYARGGDLCREDAEREVPTAQAWKQEAEAALFAALRGAGVPLTRVASAVGIGADESKDVAVAEEVPF